MIMQRFKAVGWVAAVAFAATLLYLISLQVAVERGKLEAVEAQISSVNRELRQLQTEMGTRASMRQLERWNGDVLALSAPKATQFVNNGAQLVALDLDIQRSAPNAPPPVMASLAVPPPVEAETPIKAEAVVTSVVAVAVAAASEQRSSKPKGQRVAMMTTNSTRELAKLAQLESLEHP